MHQLNSKRRAAWVFSMIFSMAGLMMASCSSGPEVKQQAYAHLKNHRTIEYDFPVVWKAIEETFRNYHVTDRDPEVVSVVEMRSIRERTLDTDWIIGKSRDKYIEFKVNDLPKKQYLQTRVRYYLKVNRILGGTDVWVGSDEQIERLHEDGTAAGWEDAENKDSSRANEILDKIGKNVLSAPPAQDVP